MKFYGRESEIADLLKVREISHQYARFTVVTGRRRVGKTELIRHVFNDRTDPYVHLVITKQTEKVQCAKLQALIERDLGVMIHGTCTHFSELFEELMKESTKRPFTLVLDEFQEFDKVDSAIFAEIAGIWDAYHNQSKINLVVCGSINRLMNKIFFNDSEPLYGRTTGRLDLLPFKVSVLKEILSDFKPNWTNGDLLDLWTITGGVARYVELLMENGATDREAMITTFFGGITTFTDEGRAILSEEFGKEYGTYFTILASIASGRTSFAEINNEVGMDVGGYLTRLEAQYGLIAKKQPIYEKTSNKNCLYQIDDCFFRFWFRFVVGYQDLVELRQTEELRQIVRRDFDIVSGYALERYFIRKFAEEASYAKMGGWWDRRGENEIDLVCEKRAKGSIDFYEVKRNPERIDLSRLEGELAAFFAKNPDLTERKGTVAALSTKDM